MAWRARARACASPAALSIPTRRRRCRASSKGATRRATTPSCLRWAWTTSKGRPVAGRRQRARSSMPCSLRAVAALATFSALGYSTLAVACYHPATAKAV
eukprot:scaffold5896_cov54-Phaeocystis_antarctica.AAC.3